MSTCQDSDWRTISVHASNCNISFYKPEPTDLAAFLLPSIRLDEDASKCDRSSAKVEVVDLTEDTDTEEDDVLSCIEVLPNPTPKKRKRARSNGADLGGNKRRRECPSPVKTTGRTAAEGPKTGIDQDQFKQLPYDSDNKDHRWTEEQRVVACVLRRWYTNSWKELVEVFNFYFFGGIAAGEEHLSARKLSAQWTDLHRYGIESSWRKVYGTPFQDCERWLGLRKELEGGAEALGIRLFPAACDSETLPKCRKGRKTLTSYDRKRIRAIKRKLKLEALCLPVQTSRAQDRRCQYIGQATVAPPPSYSTAARSLPSPAPSSAPSLTPPASQESLRQQLWAAAGVVDLEGEKSFDSIRSSALAETDGWTNGNLPALLYRMYHEDSAGINNLDTMCAAYFDGFNVIPPPKEGQDRLAIDIAKHLWHDLRKGAAPTVPNSPFMSCTESLIFAMAKAVQQEKRGKTPYITVIDAKAAMADGKGFYAATQAKIAGRTQPLSDMKYVARFEWLIWGEIPASARLRTLSLAELRAFSDFNLDMDLTFTRLLDTCPAHSLSVPRLRAALKKKKLRFVTPHVLGALAAHFGLGPGSAAQMHTEMLVQFVYNVLQGWCLHVANHDGCSDEEEERAAGAFVDGLFARDGRMVLAGEEKGRAKKAFLEGVGRARMALMRESRVGEWRKVKKVW